MIQRIFDQDGKLREGGNDDARVVTLYDASGAQTGTRPYTDAENAAADDRAALVATGTNRSTIETRAVTALQTNRTFLALASPTNAQTVAQVKALTRQMNGLTRLMLDRLDATD